MPDNYPSDWDSRRKRVYQRDNYTCQNCGVEGGSRGHEKIHAHHIVPTSRGGSHDMSNLTTICKKCHKAIHNKNRNARKEDSSDDSINPDNYEGIERGALMIAVRSNELASLSTELKDHLEKIHKNSHRLFEYVETPEDSIPNKLEESYVESRINYSNVVVDLRSQLARSREVVPQFDFPENFVDAAESVFNSQQNYIQIAIEIEEAHSQIATVENNQMSLHVTSADSVEWDIDVTIAVEELGDATQKVDETSVTLNESMNNLSESLEVYT